MFQDSFFLTKSLYNTELEDFYARRRDRIDKHNQSDEGTKAVLRRKPKPNHTVSGLRGYLPGAYNMMALPLVEQIFHRISYLSEQHHCPRSKWNGHSYRC